MGTRITAAIIAVAMIGSALWWRSRDTTTPTPTTPTQSTTEIASVICPPDLVDACRAAATASGITVDQQAIDQTLAAQAPPQAWVTMSPFPAAATYGTATELTETAIASSPLSLIVLSDRAVTITAKCGDPVDWNCLGQVAGAPWTDVGGEGAWGTVRPGLSPSSTAIGAISISAAVTSFFKGRSIDATDAGFISWARQFARAVPPSSLSAGTAVATIQVRSSTLDIAAGSAAELAAPNAERFNIVEVGDNMPITVVLATADGVQIPAKFVDALRTELVNNGWTATTSAASTIAGGDARAALAAWEEMQ